MGKKSKAERRADHPLAKAEVRSVTGSWLGHFPDGGGHSFINPRAAETLSVLCAAVDTIAGNLASLPACIYRIDGDQRIEVPDHPVMTLVRRGANRWQSWRDWLEWLVASTLLRGNGLTEVVRDSAGNVTELRPSPWDATSVTMLPSGRLVFDVTDITSTFGGTGRIRRLLDSEVLFLKDRSDDGIVGRSRLQRAYGSVRTAMQVQSFAKNMWRHGVFPAGVVQSKAAIGADGMRQLRENFDEVYSGTEKAARVIVLDAEMTFTSLSVSPEDAELIASRRFSVEEIARLYGVPPLMLGDLTNSSFNNAETMLRFFASMTLQLWVTRIEQEFDRSVLSPGYSLKLDISALMRGDPAQRWTAHEIAVRNNILTVDEVREIEGYNPMEAPASGEPPLPAQ